MDTFEPAWTGKKIQNNSFHPEKKNSLKKSLKPQIIMIFLPMVSGCKPLTTSACGKVAL